MAEIIMEIENSQGTVSVEKDGNVYNVKVDDVIKHPDCDADAVIRVLGHYLHGTNKKSPIPYSELFEMLESTSKYEYICVSTSYYGFSSFKEGIREKVLARGTPGSILIDLLSANGTGNRLFEVYTDGVTVDLRQLKHVKVEDLDAETLDILKFYFMNNIDSIAERGITKTAQLLEVFDMIEDS